MVSADAADYAALIMGDELAARADFALRDPSSLRDMLAWMWRNVAPDATLAARLQRIAVMLGRGSGSLMAGLQAIWEVGARIAGRLGLPEPVQHALFNLWECWNGKGPRGLRGDAIPLYARIAVAAFIVDSFAGIAEALARRPHRTRDGSAGARRQGRQQPGDRAPTCDH